MPQSFSSSEVLSCQGLIYPRTKELGMPVLKRKSKVVTFRASAEEHDALVKSCLEAGARSISAFARAATMEKLQSLGGPVTISGDLTNLSRTLSELDSVLREASDRIRHLLGKREEDSRAAEHR